MSSIEEILKDIEENRLTNPRVAVVKTLEAIMELDAKAFARYVDDSIIEDLIKKAKESK